MHLYNVRNDLSLSDINIMKVSNVYDVVMNGFRRRRDMHPIYVQNVVVIYGINQELDVRRLKVNP
jgi:hypothetical protein